MGVGSKMSFSVMGYSLEQRDGLYVCSHVLLSLKNKRNLIIEGNNKGSIYDEGKIMDFLLNYVGMDEVLIVGSNYLDSYEFLIEFNSSVIDNHLGKSVINLFNQSQAFAKSSAEQRLDELLKAKN